MRECTDIETQTTNKEVTLKKKDPLKVLGTGGPPPHPCVSEPVCGLSADEAKTRQERQGAGRAPGEAAASILGPEPSSPQPTSSNVQALLCVLASQDPRWRGGEGLLRCAGKTTPARSHSDARAPGLTAWPTA